MIDFAADVLQPGVVFCIGGYRCTGGQSELDIAVSDRDSGTGDRSSPQQYPAAAQWY